MAYAMLHPVPEVLVPTAQVPPPASPPTPERRSRRVPSWLVTVALALLIVGFFVGGVGAAGGLVFGFAILTPIERIWKRHDQKVRRPGLRTDMFHLLLTGGIGTVFLVVPIVVWFVLLTPVRDNPVASAFNGQTAWLRAIEAFLLLEVLTYWAHRLEHEVPVFWRFHAVHHSSERLDWISGARLHPVEGAIIGSIVAAPLLLVGVGPGTLGVFTVVTQLWGILLHMNVRWRMRPLDGVWSSTDYHHWHHSNHREARNKNYAGFLPVLDIIFGTYYMPKDRRPEVYGIDDPMPDGWFRQLLHPFRRKPRTATPAAAPATIGGRGGWSEARIVAPRLDRNEIMRTPLGV